MNIFRQNKVTPLGWDRELTILRIYDNRPVYGDIVSVVLTDGVEYYSALADNRTREVSSVNGYTDLTEAQNDAFKRMLRSVDH